MWEPEKAWLLSIDFLFRAISATPSGQKWPMRHSIQGPTFNKLLSAFDRICVKRRQGQLGTAVGGPTAMSKYINWNAPFYNTGTFVNSNFIDLSNQYIDQTLI